MHRYDMNAFFSRSSDVVAEDHELFRALDRLPTLTPTGPWLAGGALRRTLSRTPLDSDFDFFFASAEQFASFCEGLKARGGWKISENEHNVTFRLPSKAPEPTGQDEFSAYEPELTIQAINTTYYPTLEAVLDSFDFTLCQFGYDGADLVCGDYALWDLGRKRLVTHRITYGTASLRRLLKYTRQGFTACGGSLSEFLEKVASEPSVINRETLYID